VTYTLCRRLRSHRFDHAQVGIFRIKLQLIAVFDPINAIVCIFLSPPGARKALVEKGGVVAQDRTVETIVMGEDDDRDVRRYG
jgi:hypothetical protein